MTRLMLAVAVAVASVVLAGVAEAQLVTRSDLIVRTRLEPGRTEFPTVTIDRPMTRVLLQINPNLQDWADPAFLLTLEIEEFRDGAWRFWTSVNIQGNTFRKDGSLPGIEFSGLSMPAVGTSLRGAVTLNASKRVGLVLEIEE